MNTEGQPNSAHRETRLESWKEIEAYVKRDFRTLRRWEKEEGFPVHRHTHKSRASVYAFPSEIDSWRASRRQVPEPEPPRPLWKMPAFALTLALCLVMVGNGIRPQTASAQTMQAARQVWAEPGEVSTNGAMSGDGRFLSHTDEKTGNLAIRDMGTGEKRLLTENANWNAAPYTYADHSCFSGDGRRVFYEWWTTSEGPVELRVIPATGGRAEPRVISKIEDFYQVRGLACIPDGSHILVDIVRPNLTHQLLVMRADGGETRALKSFDWRLLNKMSVSPDGRYVAYDLAPNEDNPEHDIYLLAVDGSSESRVVQNPADDLVAGWSPDGKALLFISDRTGGMGLWSIAVADGKANGPATLVRKETGMIKPLGVSSKGTLYYSMNTGMREVSTIAIDPETLEPISAPVQPAQRFLGSNYGADWSPDGKYLAYLSTRSQLSNSPSLITIHSLTDGTERDVMPKLAYVIGNQGVHWSLDGRSIYVSAVDRKGQRGMFKVDAQTGDTVSVTRGIITRPVWSPDGRTMYFVRARQEAMSTLSAMKVLALDMRVNTERELYSFPVGYFAPLTISPDGKYLVFLDNLPGNNARQLMLLSTEEGKARVLVEAPVDGAVMHWAADSDSLMFVKPGARGRELWRIEVGTGEQSFVSGKPNVGLNRGRISPDGRHLSYNAGGQVPEVWALENFLPTAVARK